MKIKMAEGPVQSTLNEAALKRFDPYVDKILDVAKYVALYSFEKNAWKKTEVEGSLFVYSRSGEPFYNIIVLNRLNKNNLVESITPQVDIEQHKPFLLYRNNKGSILGIWFFDKSECVRLTSLIEELIAKTTQGSKPQIMAAEDGQGVDLFKMLTKAQEAYSVAKEGKPIPQRKSPCEMDGTPKSVAEFFAKAGSAPHAGNFSVSLGRTKTVSELEAGSTSVSGSMPKISKLSIGRPQNKMDNGKKPVPFQELMSNPLHSVEHIEKQQRVITPHSAEAGPLKNLTRGQPPGFVYTGTPPLDDALCSSIKRENGLNGMVSLPVVASPPGFITTTEEKKPDLMPPAMFTPRGPSQSPPEPLTRNQLLQAFDYLLRNDPDFMVKLHEAYVKSLSDKIL